MRTILILACLQASALLGGCASPGDFATVPACNPVTHDMQVLSRWKWFSIGTEVKSEEGRAMCKALAAQAATQAASGAKP